MIHRIIAEVTVMQTRDNKRHENSKQRFTTSAQKRNHERDHQRVARNCIFLDREATKSLSAESLHRNNPRYSRNSIQASPGSRQ